MRRRAPLDPHRDRALDPGFARPVGWLHRRAENVLAALLALMFVAFIAPDRLPLPAQLADRLDQRAQRHPVALAGPVGAPPSWSARSEEIRFDLIYGASGPRTRGSWSLVSAVALVALYAISLPAVVDYVTFMKVEKTAYLEHPLRLAVLDLRRLRGRDRSCATSGSAGRRCAARRRRRPTRPRRAPAYEPRQPVLACRSSRSRSWPSSACRSATR